MSNIAVNSLQNFGIPGYDGFRGPTLAPILSNRFRVVLYNFGIQGSPASELTRQVRSVNLPSVEFQLQTLHSYVSTAYIVTRAEWQPITIKFLSDINSFVLSDIFDQVSKQMNFFDQTMSRAGENYKFEMDIDLLAGGSTAGSNEIDPNILQKWSLVGCEIVTFDPGEASQENSDGLEYTMQVRYDNCITFNSNGAILGRYHHTAEINSRQGTFTTGIGVVGGTGVTIGGNSASINAGANLSFAV